MLGADGTEMYSQAHRGYDSTNRILSFFRDSSLRRLAAGMTLESDPSIVADLATGTGDTAIFTRRIAKERGLDTEVVGIDANADMLRVATEKAKNAGLSGIKFVKANVYKLPYGSGHFDAVSCSFSVKNFNDIDGFLKEAHRVLRRNGALVILDTSMPGTGFGRLAFYVYFAYMKLIGALAQKELYRWLPGSTAAFDRRRFIGKIRRGGFSSVRVSEFLFGIAYIVRCRKG
ncbi:MAG: class I SAM-dependent methyltransferase [Candidatus Micrarchaeota archaeon]|nr:class I SAM-dependent methyltransferase [Candidatus Micrarchaeota archaeon]